MLLSLHLTALTVALAVTFSSHAGQTDTERVVAYTIRETDAAGRTRQFGAVSTATRARADLLRTQDGAVDVLDAILWSEGAARPIGLNSKNETWFELFHTESFAPRSRYLTPLPGGSAENVKWHLADLGADAEGVRRYKGTLSYDVHGDDRLKVLCDATFEIATTTKVDRKRWPWTDLAFNKLRSGGCETRRGRLINHRLPHPHQPLRTAAICRRPANGRTGHCRGARHSRKAGDATTFRPSGFIPDAGARIRRAGAMRKAVARD